MIMQDSSVLAQYLLLFLVPLAVTTLTVPACRVLAISLGCVAKVRERDIHTEPVPYMGGIAMYIGLWATYLVASSLPAAQQLGSVSLSDTRNVLLASGIIFVFGIADDVFDLSAAMKLGAQLVTGGFLAFAGVSLILIPLPGGQLLAVDAVQSGLLTVLLIAVASNAVNFVDGLDGLAAGIVGAGASGLVIYSAVSLFDSRSGLGGSALILSLGLIGVCSGFYIHNAYPARIFMGDGGSLMLGTVLAAASILSVQLFPAFNANAEGVALGSISRVGVFLWIILPIAVLGLPLFDLTLAVIRRLRRGTSIFLADREHLHHVVLRRGDSHRAASISLTVWAGILSCGGAWIVVRPSVLHVAVVAAMALAAFVWNETALRWRRRKSNDHVEAAQRRQT